MTKRSWLQWLHDLGRGYGWVVLVPSAHGGFLFAVLTFFDPGAGAMGVVGALCAWYAGQLSAANGSEKPICALNGLLTGLFIGHTWDFTATAVGLAAMAGLFAGWVTVVLGRMIWGIVQVPVLSLPFALVAMLTGAAAPSLTTLQYRSYVAPPALFANGIDHFLVAFGSLYYATNPYVGLAVLIVLTACSRYYLALATMGYLSAQLWLVTMGAAPEHFPMAAWETNAICSALAVGGLFARPTLATAALALLAAVITSWMGLALGHVLEAVHLTPLSVPFVITTWLMLYAAARNVGLIDCFNLLTPDFPERSHERAQIGRSRVGHPVSVPLATPFMGAWTVSQGFAGEHTHRGPWRYALDFIVVKGGKSFAAKGQYLTDFHCYGLPVLSPAYGQVWRIVNDVPDNAPGATNVATPWGNCVVIRTHDGKFVVLAHLKPGSVSVVPGTWVKPGDLLGHCGNSGRSPQPHIHMHVQAADEPGAPTLPFHLASMLVAEGDEPARYELAIVPREGMTLHATAIDAAAQVRPLYLLAGRGLRYSVACREQVGTDWTLHCEVDALGRLTLVSSHGGRCVAESTWAVFSCYERGGKADPYLDLWLLSCGFTPASFEVEHWFDRFVPGRLLPRKAARWLSQLVWPSCSFAESQFERRWDAPAQSWRQEGRHRQRLSGLKVSTTAWLVPQLGCTYICAQVGDTRYTMQATSSFQRPDIGVPPWEVPLFSHGTSSRDSIPSNLSVESL
jgi:murein DD-endopeptidase MepM/ murein hydrolase activator NlpD/urea transporter